MNEIFLLLLSDQAMMKVLATQKRSLAVFSIIVYVVILLYHKNALWHGKIYVLSYGTDTDQANASDLSGIALPTSFATYYSFDGNVSLRTDVLNSFYSSFQCVGANPGDLNTEKNWHERQCIFHNVCLRRNKSSPMYIADYFYPSSIKSLGSTLIRSNNTFLALRHGLSGGDGSTIRVQLVPMNHLDPADQNKNLSYLNDTYLMYHILPDSDMNFGHIIFDDAFGLYATLKQFQATRSMSPNKTRVLVYQPCSEFQGHLNVLCQKFTDGIFRVMTSYPIHSIDSLFNSSVNANRICFRQLVAGQGTAGAVGWGPRNFNRAQAFSEFRSDLLSAHGINSNIIPKQHHILLVNKNGRRKFKNLNEIYNKIRSTPQYAGIKITITDDFTNLTITKQLQLFQTVTIAISPCGGISLLFFFLPRQSVLIVSGYPFRTKQGFIAARLEPQIWDYQSHLRVIHYPVESNDDFTLPPGHKLDDWASFRNYADVILKAEKLFPLIDNAIITTAMKSS